MRVRNRYPMSAMEDPNKIAEIETIEKTADKVAKVLVESNIAYRQVDDVFSEVYDLLKEEERRKSMDKEKREVIEMCKPIAEYLQRNFHPHASVIIEVDRIRVEESIACCPLPYNGEDS